MIKTLIHLYGNKTGQRFLEHIVRKAHLYMGIGSGENVYESGEAGVLHKLKTLKPPYCIFDVGSNKGQYLDWVLTVLKALKSWKDRQCLGRSSERWRDWQRAPKQKSSVPAVRHQIVLYLMRPCH